MRILIIRTNAKISRSGLFIFIFENILIEADLIDQTVLDVLLRER